MPPKRKAPGTIDLTSSPAKAAFDPRVLLNPKAALRKQHSSPEKEFNAQSAFERLHGVQERRAPVTKKAKKDDQDNKTIRGTSGGIVGKDLQDASKKQIELSRLKNSVHIDKATQIIDISDGVYSGEEEEEEDVKVVPGSASNRVCFGMLKASINAFSIPDVSSVLPNQWPRTDCVMERGNGAIIHVKHKGVRFGVISSDTAAPLSRLMQLDLCQCDGRIPARPRYSSKGENLAGVSAILPFEIIVYGSADHQERIGTILSQKNVFLIQPTAYNQSFPYVNPHVRQAFKVGGSAQYGTSTFKTAEEVRSEIETLFNRIQTVSNLVEHEQPIGLATPLLKHQRQALTFCLDHEDPKASSTEYSVWREVVRAGKHIWRNRITPQVLYQEPVNASGGIIADEMGLGKTLSIIALICATKAAAQDFQDNRRKLRSTLIICPLSVLSNWTEQINSHVERDCLRVLVHHDKTRTYKVSDFKKYDVILTTYATVANEFKHQKTDREVILPNMEFYRIVLDEAHTIKEIATQNSQATIALHGQHRWALTATPVQNSLNDLAALFSFLQVSPFDSRQVWNQYISQPMKSGDSIAVTRLQTLLKMRVLRRVKEQGENAEKLLSLPPRSEEIRVLKLDEAEQEVYNTHLEYYQRRTQGMGKFMKTINVLQNINQLRQICISPALLPKLDPSDSDLAETADEMTEEELLDLIDGEVCAVCQSVIEINEDESVAYYTPKCLHFFCNEHGSTVTGRSVKCPAPNCKGFGPLESLTIASETDNKERQLRKKKKKKISESPPYSTKVKALITDLTNINEQSDAENPVKSIVFSQFTSFLDLIGLALTDLGISFARLDGSMAREERTAQLSRFEKNPDLRVMIVSTRAGGVGLNLTMASKVFLMEPSWNPSIESQACDRVHRIGQTKPVSYTRYIVEGSIEQTMLKLQTQKKNLANLSLSSKLGGDESITKSLLDLRKLF